MSRITIVFAAIWSLISAICAELDPVIELFIYLGIAYLMTILFGLSFLKGVAVVFAYFLLNLARILVEAIRNKYR